jgi:hypothetical protein
LLTVSIDRSITSYALLGVNGSINISKLFVSIGKKLSREKRKIINGTKDNKK